MDQDALPNSWHERIRERALQLWEGEGRPLGRDEQHWLRAEEELWRETLGTATALAERLNRMGRSLDEGTEDGLRTAAGIGCDTMKFLIGETDFAAQLRMVRSRPMLVGSPDSDAYFKHLDLFADFLSVERKILIRSGLEPVLAEQIISFLNDQLERLRAGHIAAVEHVLEVAVHRACEAWELVKERKPSPVPTISPATWYRRAARGVWMSLGGGLVVISNVAADAVIMPGLSEFSKMSGGALFSLGLDRLIEADYSGISETRAR